MDISRDGGLMVYVRGGSRGGRRGGSKGCLHHRFSCSQFRRDVLLPSGIRGSGVSTGIRRKILFVSVPGIMSGGIRRAAGAVSIGWSVLVELCEERFLLSKGTFAQVFRFRGGCGREV